MLNSLLSLLKKYLNQGCLLGYNSKDFYDLTRDYLKKINDIKKKNLTPKILLLEQNDYKFLAAFLAGIIAECPIFLGYNQWGQIELEQVIDLVQPNLIIGLNITEQLTPNFTLINSELLNLKNKIMIPTGGTSGKIRFTIHTWETLSASVKGFTDFFEVNTVNSFCTLPLYHVSGLMQFMRSFLTGGKIIIYPYTRLKQNDKIELDLSDFFISLVPTQLQFLLDNKPKLLTQFKTILLGGAPAWPCLLDTARNYKLNVAPTYGMTETASQIVTLKPENFLSGNQSTGQVLPHANILIDSKTGLISIQAKSLFLGYYPHQENPNQFMTDDLGYFDHENYLYIVGRNNQKIITGGENVFPKEIESAILETGLVKDISVIGIFDPQWGQAVTALYLPNNSSVQVEAIKASINYKLSKFKQPKYWIPLTQLPRNQQGKLNYQKLREIALTYLNCNK
ncbi:2-succinylbenzoate--CoA ligase [Aphanothece sacrum]|uniref:O-succinylbenzoic acid--CoA ligase n=1 Tax=Aphanothece sacrum FPU1 TaxID=1920663 RepID=A0A401IG85_APHSA|nr:2-succinylbenzoate--CoA ligase [Aphanothece sacrum]GBF80226.1 O-succinylbenzoic acid--CoA ligase [Aphanothece sacrum FPU1]GBF85379.1 O-succinylbenzoate--CoA ligase [Aphanothece sacrum FPU3]